MSTIEKILELPTAFDGEEVHHEFQDGLHGRKVDLGPEGLPDDHPLFVEMTRECATAVGQSVREELSPAAFCIGVASGAVRIAKAIPALLPGRSIGLASEKSVDSNGKATLWLPDETAVVIKNKPRNTWIIEDVGTTGSSSVQLVKACLDLGVLKDSITVLNYLQRSATLKYLDEIEVRYVSVYDMSEDERFAAFTPELCAEIGHCAKGSKLIPLQE